MEKPSLGHTKAWLFLFPVTSDKWSRGCRLPFGFVVFRSASPVDLMPKMPLRPLGLLYRHHIALLSPPGKLC